MIVRLRHVGLRLIVDNLDNVSYERHAAENGVRIRRCQRLHHDTRTGRHSASVGCGASRQGSGYFPLRTYSPPPDHFPFPDNSHSLLHGVGHSLLPHHHHHPPIYNIKQSTVNMYKIDSGDRLRSGVPFIASFQIFALTAGGLS